MNNLKMIRACGRHWLTQLKTNRLVDPNGSGNRPVSDIVIGRTGSVVHLKGFGFIKVSKIAAPDGSNEYWATDDPTLTLEQLAQDVNQIWHVEEYHRGLKQFCGIERAQHRRAIAQRNHIGFALRAFLRLECHRLSTGLSWFEAKTAIIRQAVRAYLTQPAYLLSTA